MTKIPRKYLIILAFILILFIVGLFSTRLVRDSWIVSWIFIFLNSGILLGIISFLIIYRNQKKKKRRRIVGTLLKSSSKIKLEMIMDILDLNEEIFYREFTKWTPEFGLKIEDGYLITDKDKIPEIINGLLKKFKEWEKLGNVDKK